MKSSKLIIICSLFLFESSTALAENDICFDFLNQVVGAPVVREQKRKITPEEEQALAGGCRGIGCPSFEKLNMGSISYANVDDGKFRGSEFDVFGYSTDLTKIQNSDLRDVTIDLLGACNLAGSDLRGAIIKKITASGSDDVGSKIFDRADLRGATILEISLIQSVSFNGTIYDSTTKLPFTDEVATSLGMIRK
jgi:uncharacterized protein YjbI with pentapeptide repeats